MGTGYLITEVYIGTDAIPVEEAEVEIFTEDGNIIELTDINGKTKKIPLKAPNKEYSLEPQSKVMPYSTYSIKVSKSGLEPSLIEGVEIFDGETSIQKVYLTKLEHKGDINYEDLPPHVLWGNYPPKIDESNVISNIATSERVMPSVLIPEYIIVHDGTPTNNTASNYAVTFPDYIKNVASSEIYSTWPKETIKANIIAIISFTLSRVYSEWYPSKGYAFTITSSTAYDQKYTHGRTIFQSISDVVDQVFNVYIRRSGVKQPFFAQYNDGVKTNNNGWLSQWGSKDLGDKGYKAIDILKYYYVNDLSLIEAGEIEGLPSSFPGNSLSKGSCGEDVQVIQNELNTISGNYPAIPKVVPPDGVFGPMTESSVKKFQSVFGLPATGVVDFTTWYKISYIYIAVSKMLQGVYG